MVVVPKGEYHSFLLMRLCLTQPRLSLGVIENDKLIVMRVPKKLGAHSVFEPFDNTAVISAPAAQAVVVAGRNVAHDMHLFSGSLGLR